MSPGSAGESGTLRGRTTSPWDHPLLAETRLDLLGRDATRLGILDYLDDDAQADPLVGEAGSVDEVEVAHAEVLRQSTRGGPCSSYSPDFACFSALSACFMRSGLAITKVPTTPSSAASAAIVPPAPSSVFVHHAHGDLAPSSHC